jgi:hypothetical protein
MRRLRMVLLVGGLAGLALAGIAIADGAPTSSKAVGATFAATTVSDLRTSTCVGTDGTYQLTKATYSGTASSSEPRLNGSLVVHLRAWVNATTHVGAVRGSWSVAGGARGLLAAADSNGALSGWLSGAGVEGTFTAGWTSNGGLTSGALGSGSLTSLAILAAGRCGHHNDNDDQGDHHHHG